MRFPALPLAGARLSPLPVAGRGPDLKKLMPKDQAAIVAERRGRPVSRSSQAETNGLKKKELQEMLRPRRRRPSSGRPVGEGGKIKVGRVCDPNERVLTVNAGPHLYIHLHYME